jgi:hypothetical protein
MRHQTATRVSRRTFLATSAAASAIVISGSAIIKPSEAWGHDEKAATDAELKGLIEDGMAKLNTLARNKNSVDYADLANEGDRTAVLRDVENDAFFQKVRSSLITGLYNNKEVWPVFGYEGESASKGGYINRGFNDLDWL